MNTIWVVFISIIAVAVIFASFCWLIVWSFRKFMKIWASGNGEPEMSVSDCIEYEHNCPVPAEEQNQMNGKMIGEKYGNAEQH